MALSFNNTNNKYKVFLPTNLHNKKLENLIFWLPIIPLRSVTIWTINIHLHSRLDKLCSSLNIRLRTKGNIISISGYEDRSIIRERIKRLFLKRPYPHSLFILCAWYTKWASIPIKSHVLSLFFAFKHSPTFTILTTHLLKGAHFVVKKRPFIHTTILPLYNLNSCCWRLMRRKKIILEFLLYKRIKLVFSYFA